MTTMFSDLMNGLEEVDSFLAGKTAGYKVSVSTDVDVKTIRKRLNMTQAKFSDAFGFSIDAVKHWEGGRRTPEASARAFLTVISRNPTAVLDALHPTVTAHRTSRSAEKKVAEAPSRKEPQSIKRSKKQRPVAAQASR
jgi:putative transcriptional regulator